MPYLHIFRTLVLHCALTGDFNMPNFAAWNWRIIGIFSPKRANADAYHVGLYIHAFAKS